VRLGGVGVLGWCVFFCFLCWGGGGGGPRDGGALSFASLNSSLLRLHFVVKQMES